MKDVVRRSVLDLLQRNRLARLVTVRGATGSGKSTLLRQWHAELQGQGVRTLALQALRDQDDLGFARALLATVTTTALNTSPLTPVPEGDVEQLGNRLYEILQELGTPLCVIIDDFHRLRSPAINRLLTRLVYLETRSPLTIVLATRIKTDIPLAALRLDGGLLEIEPSDLRFTTTEADDMARQAGLSSGLDSWRHFVGKVDGWAVALRLALVLLRGGKLALEELRDFSGDQHDMTSFLSEQILLGLPPSDRNLLLRCSAFLSLRPDVLGAVLGNSQALRALKLVAELGLPQDPVPNKDAAVRLHNVVLNFLASQAREAGVDVDADRRATAEYLTGKGEWRRAISYALDADDLLLAGRIAEQGGGWRLVYRGEAGTAAQFQSLAALPRAAYRDFPRLALGLSIAAAKRGEIEHALDIRDQIERVIDTKDAALRAEFRLITALLDLYQDRSTGPDEVARLVNDIADPGRVDPVRLGLTENLLCYCSLQTEDFDAAIRYGRISIATFSASGSEFGAAHLPLHIGQAEYFSGRIENARATLGNHLDHCETVLGKGADLTLMTKALLAEIEVEQGRLPVSDQELDGAFARLGSRDTWFDPLASLVLSRVRMARLAGNAARAEEVLGNAERVAAARGYGRLTRFVSALRIELLLKDRQHADARILLALARGARESRDPEGAGRPVSLRGPRLEELDARLKIDEDDHDNALAVLGQIGESPQGRLNVPRSIRLNLLKIRALLAMGRDDAARKHLDWLVLAQPVDAYPLPFTDEGAGLASFVVARAGEADPQSLTSRRLKRVAKVIRQYMPQVGAPTAQIALTESEAQIVTLVAAGLSNKEMSRTLGISDNTVKFHLTNIYRKLSVTSRTAAIARAREAGLLS
ncbi:MAG: AAA family ATPase [Rhodobacteraceae bacterium]|nr:AAA family ATPase [Paracoccaceae bacterium]